MKKKKRLEIVLRSNGVMEEVERNRYPGNQGQVDRRTGTRAVEPLKAKTRYTTLILSVCT